MALRKGKLDYAEMIKTYMSAKKEMQLLDETNWSILANGVSDIDSDPFHFIIGYRDEYAKVISRERVMRKIVFTVNQSLNELAALSDTVSFQRQRNYAESIHEYCVDSVIFIADLLLFETTKDWNAYQKETLLNTEKYVWNDDHKLREIGNNYLKNIVDTAALLKASSWAKYALLLNSDYAGTMLAAKLFQKAGSKKESVEMAKQAKAMALQYGWNYKDADELIKHSGN
jgi:hypothetical protein